MYARPFIDSLDFAGNGRYISGEVQVAELPRLFEMLENPRGVLKYTVQGGVDTQDTHFLDLSVSGRCQLRCQRCLGGLDYQVQLDTHLLLRDQDSLDLLDEIAGGDEEFDSILADEHMDILDMLEEEILLSLPIAPKHEFGACQAASDVHRNEARHPFAVLAKLKSN
jgi:DUF177 domain-containing protein